MIGDTLLLSLSEILRRWNFQQSYYAQWGEEFGEEYHDRGRIRNVIFHPRRIPIARSSGQARPRTFRLT